MERTEVSDSKRFLDARAISTSQSESALDVKAVDICSATIIYVNLMCECQDPTVFLVIGIILGLHAMKISAYDLISKTVIDSYGRLRALKISENR